MIGAGALSTAARAALLPVVAALACGGEGPEPSGEVAGGLDGRGGTISLSVFHQPLTAKWGILSRWVGAYGRLAVW